MTPRIPPKLFPTASFNSFANALANATEILPTMVHLEVRAAQSLSYKRHDCCVWGWSFLVGLHHETHPSGLAFMRRHSSWYPRCEEPNYQAAERLRDYDGPRILCRRETFCAFPLGGLSLRELKVTFTVLCWRQLLLASVVGP